MVGVFLIVIIGASLITNSNKQDAKNECEEIGREYKKVGTTFAGKSGVDIFECVK